MRHFYSLGPLIMTIGFLPFNGLLGAAASTTAIDSIVPEKRIITLAPPAKEIVEAPSGFMHCFTVKEGWNQTLWVPEHRVCQYENSSQGVAWIQGYWNCSQHRIDSNECTGWEWKPPHWEPTFAVF
ncbi:MAG: hypothetical protein H0W64_10715 [Gammaproteobacteria bacterium]|nr:hypothetical protein [Gammaproteobacteria bacterium]